MGLGIAAICRANLLSYGMFFFSTSARLRIGEMRAVPGNWWAGFVILGRPSDCGRVSAVTPPQFERSRRDLCYHCCRSVELALCPFILRYVAG